LMARRMLGQEKAEGDLMFILRLPR
jgi:hypothetical protein